MAIVPYEGSATQLKRAEANQPANYAPYCLMCETMARMTQIENGFWCEPIPEVQHPAMKALGLQPRYGCGNKINWNWEHL